MSHGACRFRGHSFQYGNTNGRSYGRKLMVMCFKKPFPQQRAPTSCPSGDRPHHQLFPQFALQPYIFETPLPPLLNWRIGEHVCISSFCYSWSDSLPNPNQPTVSALQESFRVSSSPQEVEELKRFFEFTNIKVFTHFLLALILEGDGGIQVVSMVATGLLSFRQQRLKRSETDCLSSFLNR
jgi:hypothetical protein